MQTPDVIFPNIGITINNLNRVAISIFGASIYWYAIFVLLGITAGVALALWNVKRCGGNVTLYSDFGYIVIPACIVGTRLFFVIFNWDMYRDAPLTIITEFGTGLAIFGAIITAFLTAVIYCRVKKESFFKFVDLGIIGLPVGQAIGRWGNFFNREAFGAYTDSFFAMQYRLSEVNSNAVTDEMRANLVFRHYEDTYDITHIVQYISVHPTFLYESLWNIGTVILLYVFCKRRKFDGQIAAMYLLLYGIGRFWIESLRTDQLTAGSLPISQVLAALAAIGGAGYIAINIYTNHRRRKKAL